MSENKHFTEKIIQHRWLIIAIVILLTLVFGYGLTRIRINPDIISSLPNDDEVAQLYTQIGDEFGGNDMGLVVLETDDIFQLEVLEHIQMVTDSILFSPGVITVTSLTNMMDIKSSEWGIEIGKLVDEYEMPTTQEEVDELKAYVMSKDMYKELIVSEQGDAAAIMFTFESSEDKQAIARIIKEKIESLNLPETIYYGGLPMMMNDVSDLIINDIIWLVPIVFVLIASILLFSFRSLNGLLMPLLSAGIAIIWTMGIMAFTGFELTIITNIIPVVLLAVGSAYSIHILNSVNNASGETGKEKLLNALKYITTSVILASATTIVGFISFVFGAYLLMIRNFGIFSAVGTGIALLLSVFFVPALLAVQQEKNKDKASPKKRDKVAFIDRILTPLIEYVFKHPKFTLSIWLIALIISIWGIFRIQTSVNIVDYFKKDNPARVSENVLQEKFGGTMPVFIVFEGDIQDPKLLQSMAETALFMKTDPNISIAQSVADLIEQMNDAMGEGLLVPDERAKIEQLWFLLDGQEIMSQLVNDDLTKGVILAKLASIDSRDMASFTAKMEQYIEEHQSDEFTMSLTGMPSVYVELENSLVKSQYTSVIIAIVMVIIIVGLMLKSFKRGLYTSLPVISTVIILLGFLGLTGISLDIATVLVASIAMGIGIDYSIHIITGYNKFLSSTGNTEEAIRSVLKTSGKAVIINLSSVAAGFLVLLFSNLIPLQSFGLLVALSMLVSGLGALTMLPATLLLAYRNENNTKN